MKIARSDGSDTQNNLHKRSAVLATEFPASLFCEACSARESVFDLVKNFET